MTEEKASGRQLWRQTSGHFTTRTEGSRTENRKLPYSDHWSDSTDNIGVGNSFNALINSGIVHPTGVLIVPFIASINSSALGDAQCKSPFDTCPDTPSPLSLIYLQVTVGSKNVLKSSLQYNYEHFLKQ